MIKSCISCSWVIFQSSKTQVWHVTIATHTGPDLYSFERKIHTLAYQQSLFKCDLDSTVCWKVACWKIPQSALGLCLIKLLCSQQLSIIGGRCQCQSKAPTAPNWSKPSLQMSLRCQLKSFSWKWDGGRNCDDSLTATKMVRRPERVRVWNREGSEGVKQIDRQIKKVTERK